MELERTWALRGPNLWARVPVLEAEAHFGAFPTCAPDLTGRLAAWLSSAGDGPGAAGPPPGPHLARVLLWLAQQFQARAGAPLSFGTAQEACGDGLSRVVFAYEEEALARACLESARACLTAAIRGEAFDAPAEVARLRDLAHNVRLGPSTAAIVRAAEQRGIPARRLSAGSLVQLGQGARQRRVLAAETDRTGAIAQDIAQDKQLTRQLLHAVGVPVPRGRPVTDAEDAWRAAEELGPPVVVKPQYGNQGRGVATDLLTREQVMRAYAAAREQSSYVLVEQFVPGEDYRLLVVGGRVVAAALREPAQVTGDGRSTVAELVAEANKDSRRSDGHATALSRIKLDPISLAVLAEQGLAPGSVPPAGAKVLVRRNANLSTGGTAADVTDRAHPELAARAVDAARVVGLDVAGVDVVTQDIGRPLEEQGAVVEVNAGPGLRMHLEPSAGRPRPVGEAIVEMLFPAGETGRIPVVAVTGVNGKTTTTRLVAHLLRTAGRYVGMTCTDGTYLQGRRTDTRDCSGPQSARAVLLNPQVEVAVLETARGGILREGLGFDHCDVGVVTNIGKGDHFGLRGIETLEDLARVKRVVVEAVAPGGHAVLNAADPLVVALAPHCPGAVIFFARNEQAPALAKHREAGGRALFVRDDRVVLAEGSTERLTVALADVPMTRGGTVPFQTENALAAVAAAWALGLPADALRSGLATFTADERQVPGRFNVFEVGGATVIVDYAHNPSALAALVEALPGPSHRRRSLVFSGFNRRDQDVIVMGEIAGRGFDRIILYKDWGHSGRADGELNALFRRGVAAAVRGREVVETEGERAALELALRTLAPDELLVLGVDSIEEALALVRKTVLDGGRQ